MGIKQNWLKPNPCPPTIKKLAGFDIEASPESGKFICGSVVFDFQNDFISKSFLDKEEMQKFLLSSNLKSYYIFATNLEYDLGILYFPFEQFILSFNKSRLISAKYINNNYRWHFLDTYNHFPYSVNELGKLINLPKMKKPDFKNYDLDYLIKYNLNDSMITYLFIKYLQKEYNQIGASLKATAPSTAMDLFKRKYLKFPLKQPYYSVLENLFKGYYGGRCESFKRGYFDKPVFYFDANGLYPFSMLKNNFPNPNFLKVSNLPSKDILNFEGMSFINFSIKDLNFPLLPKLYEVEGFDKLTFPTGSNISGWYSHLEIKEALKLGYNLNKIYKSYYSTKSFNPFAEYVTDLFSKRELCKSENKLLENVYKLMSNSLYGKFGQKNIISDLINICNLTLKEFKELEQNLIPISENFFYLKKDSLASFTNPLLCSYVTAYARCYMREFYNDSTLYTDTDSNLTFDKNIKNFGNKLGQFKLVTKFEKTYIIKSKFYLGDTGEYDEEGNKIFKLACKGVKLNNIEILKEAIKNKNNSKLKVSNLHVNKIRESLRRGLILGNFNEVSKEISLTPDGKRNYLKDINPFIENTSSIPLFLEE